jgi:hypothetical protein
MNIYSPNPNDEFWASLRTFTCILDLSEATPAASCNVGKKNPMYGRRFKLTPEQIKKMVDKQTGRPLSEEHKLAISRTKTGVPRSEETKRKISEARKRSKKQG